MMVQSPTRADLRSPIDLPAAKDGEFEVRRRYGTEFDVVTWREAMMTGRVPEKVEFNPARLVHELHGPDGLWIADVPVEIRQHREALNRMWPGGKVLVGGLGLGIMASLLAEHANVDEVTAVEIAPEVARLCAPRSSKVKVVVDDFRHFLQTTPTWDWSCAFVDLWRDTGEGAWWDDVLPIRRIIGQRFGVLTGTTVQYWAEDIMLGQVIPRLMNPPRPHWYYRAELKLPMTANRIRYFIHGAGQPAWERKYGRVITEVAGE